MNKPKEKMVAYSGGAKRGGRKLPLFLCPLELVEAVADTRLEGDLKYEPGNWTKGDAEFFLECNSHAIAHLFEATDTDHSEDILTHLGHAATNIAFMLWAIRRGVIRREDFRNYATFVKANAGRQASDKPIRGSR